MSPVTSHVSRGASRGAVWSPPALWSTGLSLSGATGLPPGSGPVPPPGSTGGGDGGGEQGGGPRKAAVLHPYVQLSIDLAPQAGTVLRGLALAAIVEHHQMEGDLDVGALEQQMAAAVAGLPLPDARVERLLSIVADVGRRISTSGAPGAASSASGRISGLSADLSHRAEIGYRQLLPADRELIDLICQLDAPVIAGEMVVVLHELADYWAAIEAAMSRFAVGEGAIAGDLQDDLLRFFLTGAPWDLRTEVLSVAREGGDVSALLLSEVKSAFALRILSRLQETAWPRQHPLWSTGCSRYANDPTVQRKIVDELTAWPVAALWYVVSAADDHELQCRGEADFETAIWMVFEAIAGRRHSFPGHWLAADPVEEDSDAPDREAQGHLRARVEQASEQTMTRMARDIPGFARWRDDVGERILLAVERDPPVLNYLESHPDTVISEVYAELRREAGSQRLLQALEYDVLLGLPAHEAEVRKDPLLARRDPRGWSWFVASASFARPETLEAVPDLSHVEVAALATRLYAAYRTQLAVLETLLQHEDLGEEIPLPLHLRHAIFMFAAYAVFKETVTSDAVRDPLHTLLEEVIQGDPILDAQDLPLAHQQAVQLGLLMHGAYTGRPEVDPRSPELRGGGMAALAGMVFAGRVALQQFFDAPLPRLMKSTHLAAQALRVMEVVDWLVTESPESVGRRAFNTQWTADHPQVLESVLLIVRNVLWVARTFGLRYEVVVHPAQGIEGLRIVPAKGPMSRVVVRMDSHGQVRGSPSSELCSREGGAQQALPASSEKNRESAMCLPGSTGPCLPHRTEGSATTESGDPPQVGGRGSTRRRELEGTRAPVMEEADDQRLMLRVASIVEAVGAEIRGEMRPTPLTIALPTDDVQSLIRRILPSLVGPDTPHAGRVIVTYERGEGVPSRPLLTYTPSRRRRMVELSVDLPTPAALAAIVGRLKDTLPADRADAWTVVGTTGDRVEPESLGDPRLRNSISWRLIDGDDRILRWNGSAMSIEASRALAQVATAMEFDALVRQGREAYGWPALRSAERREALECLARMQRESPHIMAEYAARGWPLFIRRLITGAFLQSRYTPVFLSRMAGTIGEGDGPATDLRNFHTYLWADRLVSLVHDEAAVLAEMRAQWDAYVARVRAAERTLHAAVRIAEGATWDDVQVVLADYAKQIHAGNTPERAAQYLAHLPAALLQERDRGQLRTLVSSRLAFAPTQAAVWNMLQPLLLPKEVAWITSARTKRTALSRLRQAWQRLVGIYFPEEEIESSGLAQHATLWPLMLAQFPALSGVAHSDLLRLQRDLARLSPDQRTVVIDLLEYGFTDAAIEQAGIEIPVAGTATRIVH